MQSKIGKTLTAILLVLTFPLSLTAQPKNIPPGNEEQINGKRLQCYDLEGYKSLLKFDVSYTACIDTNKAVTGALVIERGRIWKLEEIIEKHQENEQILKKENDRLFKEWKEENKKRHLAENRPMFGSYLAWGAAGAFAMATTVLSVIIIIKD